MTSKEKKVLQDAFAGLAIASGDAMTELGRRGPFGSPEDLAKVRELAEVIHNLSGLIVKSIDNHVGAAALIDDISARLLRKRERGTA